MERIAVTWRVAIPYYQVKYKIIQLFDLHCLTSNTMQRLFEISANISRIGPVLTLRVLAALKATFKQRIHDVKIHLEQQHKFRDVHAEQAVAIHTGGYWVIKNTKQFFQWTFQQLEEYN